jgi:HD superfamily phosphohydrolase
LIDFGFCRGIEQPAHAPSFWNVGASRFAPPSKLDYPSKTHPTHDVFAVGVVAYLLLTNKFPWQVSEKEDRGQLRDAMLRATPLYISVANRFVDAAVARFIHRLIVVNDDARPLAAAALDEAHRLKITLAARVAAPAIREDTIAFPRVIRDPVHGDIRLTEFESSLLDTREYQRLRHIKQLGFANLVYPGAEHTRLSHSLGTMHVADKILRSIEKITGERVHPEERLLARTYALVHDVTHIPFGHTLEDELSIFERHDRNEERIGRLILSDRSSLGTALRSTEYGRAALAFFDRRADIDERLHYLRELIESPAGADVLDYIDRDSLHCGLDHRVDTAIFRRYRITARPDVPQGPHLISQLYGRHGIRLDAEYAHEWLLLQRFSLFLKVYAHPAKVAAGAMLGKAVTLATRGKTKLLDARKMEALGDADLVSLLAKCSNDQIRRYGRALRDRHLFKPCFRASPFQGGDVDLERYAARRDEWRELGLFDPDARLEIERKVAAKAKTPPSNVIVYCPSEAPGFQKIRHLVEREPGKTEPMADRIHLRAAERHLRLWSMYVLVSEDVSEEKRRTIVEETTAVFGLKNEAEVKPRQELLF